MIGHSLGRMEMCFDIGSHTVGAWAETRLHMPKAVTYHDQSHIVNHDMPQPWAYGIQAYYKS